MPAVIISHARAIMTDLPGFRRFQEVVVVILTGGIPSTEIFLDQ